MWYAMIGGSGLLLGLSLLVWGLRERNAKFAAERGELKAASERDGAIDVATKNVAIVKTLEEEMARMSAQMDIVRFRNSEARHILAEYGGSKAIAQWLDSELAAEEL